MNIAFPGATPHQREHQAITHLARILPDAEADGLITSWFFIRKGHWRVRYLPADAHNADQSLQRQLAAPDVEAIGDIYEPEIHAFGGIASMNTAHQLFHADSHHLLTYLNGTPTDRREHSLILCTALMRQAGLDFGEQGDVWARLADQRAPLRQEPPDPATWNAHTTSVRDLLLGNPRPHAIAEDWLAAFQRAGRQLRTLRNTGQLTRGIRAVTAQHVIFHWSRIGIPAPTQALLA
ncbi:thiopeptide-type bacteriocin biosynthesis protein [Actinomadura gamaensis]|uniref:Thiopeptide-type bacteriocin biosynthesis protein n=1 Tax=Actinomadura gamaensis TaxID=1763541 RepID=A0ABV9UA28_9ACTN